MDYMSALALLPFYVFPVQRTKCEKPRVLNNRACQPVAHPLDNVRGHLLVRWAMQTAQACGSISQTARKEVMIPLSKDERIRARAYELWEADGSMEGCADEYWRQAREHVEREMEAEEETKHENAAKAERL
jgi:hypothetical protein